MDFSEFADGSVLACGLHGGDTCIVIVGCYGGSSYPHRVVTIDGRTWECSDTGYARRHVLPHVASFHGVLLGEHKPTAKPDFADRLSAIEQQLSDLKSAQGDRGQLGFLAHQLVHSIAKQNEQLAAMLQVASMPVARPMIHQKSDTQFCILKDRVSDEIVNKFKTHLEAIGVELTSFVSDDCKRTIVKIGK